MSRAPDPTPGRGPEPPPDPEDPQGSSGAGTYRRETPGEKLDRNWNELLQELRVMQTGTQIVTAFLIVLPFQSRFEELAGDMLGWYVALLVSAVLITTLMLLPVVIHRRLFGLQIKDRTVAWGNLLVKVCLAGLAFLLAGCVAFIAHAVLDPVAGWWITGSTTAVIAVLMLALGPRRRSAPPRP
ncbi:hypothetical protein E7744_02675 [Citricoccus sp. SGAir0253]|uniref:DUF6328 family protein n=1 Tax=Citricoccus sp. SGAir0253 TaxID=2567881 RepID=UPI0010CD61BB|nr:DUF6328 family protein [Citricoccus sp. SGAir0253]QCU77241.1 hypothetical protein E7744_02675 [Citricoccus sp. SGAir0253]